jgi:8-oxo-dGTP pyrophosphatase MutT (NUDIX family)
VRRAGGNQVIPRPTAWRPGPAALWESSRASLPPIDVATIAAVLRARGPGKAPPMELEDARHSAVLVPLYDGPDGAEVLLTRRSQALRNHRGEVSFPGGRMDPGETPLQTALREAHEEVALDPSLPHVLGELDHLSTVASRSRIVPIVASLPGRPVVHPSSSEVARVLFVPLVDLLTPGTYREELWGSPPLDRSITFFELDDETIWGATARMLAQLLGLALGIEA